MPARRALMYNFPLHSERPDPPSNKQGSSSSSESPASGAVPSLALMHLCLLVDVTASKLKRVGRYTLGRVVGRGAFGVVRLGQNTQTGAALASSHAMLAAMRSCVIVYTSPQSLMDKCKSLPVDDAA